MGRCCSSSELSFEEISGSALTREQEHSAIRNAVSPSQISAVVQNTHCDKGIRNKASFRILQSVRNFGKNQQNATYSSALASLPDYQYILGLNSYSWNYKQRKRGWKWEKLSGSKNLVIIHITAICSTSVINTEPQLLSVQLVTK